MVPCVPTFRKYISHQSNKQNSDVKHIRICAKALMCKLAKWLLPRYLTSNQIHARLREAERGRETQGAGENSMEVCLCVSRPHHSTKTHESFISQFPLFWMQANKADHTLHLYSSSTLIWEENLPASTEECRHSRIWFAHTDLCHSESARTHLYTRVVKINLSQERLFEPLTIHL